MCQPLPKYLNSVLVKLGSDVVLCRGSECGVAPDRVPRPGASDTALACIKMVEIQAILVAL